MNKVYAIFDLETTGGSPKQERIIEIAIVKFDGEKIIDQFQSLVNPEKNIPPYVVKLTGINNKMVSKAPLFKLLINDIKDFIEGCIFVAHDINSDYGFMKYEFKSENHFFQLPKICTLKLTKKLYPDLPKYNLKFLTEKFEVEHQDRHRAMGDAIATADLLQKLLFEAPSYFIEDLMDITKSETIKNFDFEEEDIAAIPEETGIILYYNINDKLLLADLSLDMNQSISDLIFNYSGKTRKGQMLKKVKSIKTIITGSVLLAELLETEYIVKYKPSFNRKQLNSNRFTQINIDLNEDHYKTIGLKRADRNTDKMFVYSSKYSAQKSIDQLVKKFRLCHYLCSSEKNKNSSGCDHYKSNYCNGACIKKRKCV